MTRLMRKNHPTSKETGERRICRADNGEPIGRVTPKGHVLYPDDLALEIVQAVNGQEDLAKEFTALRKELRSYQVSAKDLKPIDLTPISRDSATLFTHISFEDYDLQAFLERQCGSTVPWLKFGECTLHNEGNQCFIRSPIRDGITDFEHDTCIVVHIDLIGLQYRYTRHHISHFTAYLTTDPKEIRVYSEPFDPEKVEGASWCTRCEEEHLILPEGYYSGLSYELARVVAGKKVSITFGPRSVLA